MRFSSNSSRIIENNARIPKPSKIESVQNFTYILLLFKKADGNGIFLRIIEGFWQEIRSKKHLTYWSYDFGEVWNCKFEKRFPIQDCIGNLKQTNTNAVSYGLSWWDFCKEWAFSSGLGIPCTYILHNDLAGRTISLFFCD